MDDRRFDALVRSLASGQNRRTVLKGLLGLGGLAAGAGLQATEAARRPAPTPTIPKCPGRQTWNGSACVCPSGSDKCGPECCDTGVSVCCDNACCHGECYGEELCCPTGRDVCNGTCCAAGEACFQDACHSCTACGSAGCCIDGVTQCCQSGEFSACIPTDATCCTVDDECEAVDTCTPADCLDTHQCNAVSRCPADQHCCSGHCVHESLPCCNTEADCGTPSTFCDGIVLHRLVCFNGFCQDLTTDCRGPNPCTSYYCDTATASCAGNPIPGCCQADTQCAPVDACTPGLCLSNHTCNAISSCGAGEHCCDGGTCSQGGSCGPTGCIIEGVLFPPCVDGCPTCVAPDGGTLCGCAVTTTQHCTSTDQCKELLGDAICAGPPDSAICVQPSGPLN
jgi:hypothetical protein